MNDVLVELRHPRIWRFLLRRRPLARTIWLNMDSKQIEIHVCYIVLHFLVTTCEVARTATSKQPCEPIEDWRRADGDPELAHVEIVDGCNQGYQCADIE